MSAAPCMLMTCWSCLRCPSCASLYLSSVLLLRKEKECHSWFAVVVSIASAAHAAADAAEVLVAVVVVVVVAVTVGVRTSAATDLPSLERASSPRVVLVAAAAPPASLRRKKCAAAPPRGPSKPYR